MKATLKAITLLAAVVLLFPAGSVNAQQAFASALPGSASEQQTERDEYTRYELLAPDSASFKIHYEVTATTAGARFFYNPIRKGSVASDETVSDVMTGEPLRFEVVAGAEARKDSLMANADASVDYIKVELARPVPPEGEARILILKTYKDAKSYYREGNTIVFNRPLGIKRNSVVLPAGYEVTSCNVPSQVLSEPDGRIAVSFMNASAGEAPLILKGKPGAQVGTAAHPRALTEARSWEAPFQGETELHVRIATSSTSFSSPRPTLSVSITTTPSRVSGSTSISMLCVKAARCQTRPPIFSIRAKSFCRRS